MADQRKNMREPANEGSKKDLRKFLGRGANLDVSDAVRQHPEYKNCVLRVVNNEGGRVQQMLANGWEVVQIANHNVTGVWSAAKPNDKGNTKTESTVVSRPVGRGNTVNALDAILMAKPREAFKSEERAALHERTRETELAIAGGEAAASERAAGVETYDAGSKIRIGE